MQKEFECLKCHHKFVGDDSMEVVCPQCGSDNVRYATKSVASIVLMVAAFIIAIGVGFFVVKLVKGMGAEEADEETTYVSGGGGGGGSSSSSSRTHSPSISSGLADEDDQTNTQSTKSILEQRVEEEAKKVKVEQPVTLAVKTPVAGTDGTYSFTAKAEHLPNGTTVMSYRLTMTDGKTIVAESPTGQFMGVPASAAKGRYNLYADLSNGQTVTKEGVGGFDKVQTVKEDNRMQPAELTQLINSQDKALGRGNHPKVLRTAKIVITNKSSENDDQVRMMDDIYGRIEFGEWQSVTVTEVGYDAQGRINKIVITINK